MFGSKEGKGGTLIANMFGSQGEGKNMQKYMTKELKQNKRKYRIHNSP